jgi:hypothetical protein
VRIIESTAEKFARTVRKENTIFVVSVKSIIKREDMVVKEVTELLEEYKDVFSVKSSLDLPLKRGEDDHAIPTVPRVRPQARSPYRLMPEERKVLKIQLKELIEAGHIRPSNSP